MIPPLAWTLVLLLQLADGQTLRAAVDGASSKRECLSVLADVARGADLRGRCSTRVDRRVLRLP